MRRAEAVCAFERRYEQRVLIVAACIRPASVSGGGAVPPVGAEAWEKTLLPLPDLPVGTRLKEVFTGRDLWTVAGQDGETLLPVGEILATLPVAVMETGS